MDQTLSVYFNDLETIYSTQLKITNVSRNNITKLYCFPFLSFVFRTGNSSYKEIMVDAVPSGSNINYNVNVSDYRRPSLVTDNGFITNLCTNKEEALNFINEKLGDGKIIALAISEVLHKDNIYKNTYDDNALMVVLDTLSNEAGIEACLKPYSENINISDDFTCEN